MSHTLLSLLIILLTARAAKAELYELTRLGQVGFNIYHRATEKMVKGEFGDFSGMVEFNPEIHRLIKVRATIKIAALETFDQKRDQFLREDQAFFEQARFPEIIFEIPHPVKLVQGRGVETTGKLTIKKITRPLMVALTYLGKRKQGHFFKITGRLSRRDFGITWNEKLESGVMALSDEVHLYAEAVIKKIGETKQPAL